MKFGCLVTVAFSKHRTKIRRDLRDGINPANLVENNQARMLDMEPLD